MGLDVNVNDGSNSWEAMQGVSEKGKGEGLIRACDDTLRGETVLSGTLQER